MAREDERIILSGLGNRKRDCLRLAYYRLSHQEIGDQLGLTSGTVKTYLADVRAQLGGMSTLRAAQLLAEIEGMPAPPEGELTSRQLHRPPAIEPSLPSSSAGQERSDGWLREEPPHFETVLAAASSLPEGRAPDVSVLRYVRTIGLSVAISLGLVTTVLYAADVMMAVTRFFGHH